MLFRARELRDGASADEMRRQMNEAFKLIERDLVAALAKGKVSALITESTYAAGFGEVARFAPPSGGTRLILPEPNLAQLDARVTAVCEAATGALSVEVVNGTINGATTLSYLAGIGTVEFILTSSGWYGWSVSLVDLAALAGAGLTHSAGVLAVGAGTGITVGADTVGLTQMAARRVKLRADSAGTGDPIDGTGAQVAEILRLATLQSDSASTGTIQTYTVAEATNVVRFLAGVAATTIRGATIPTETGQLVIWENNDGTGVSVTFNHEDGSAAAAGNRFRCPGAVPYVLADGHRMITCYINTRWRIVATA